MEEIETVRATVHDPTGGGHFEDVLRLSELSFANITIVGTSILCNTTVCINLILIN